MKLRKSSIKELSEKTGVEINKKADVEKINNIIFENKKPIFFYHEEKIVPTVITAKNNNYPSISVDEGATKFVIKGADIMRPGITEFDEFKTGDVVKIKSSSGSVIGVGISLFNSIEAKNLDKGKIILTLHYVGDELWKQIMS